MAKITIDKLAKIINDGFNGQMEYMEKRFTGQDKKFEDLKKDLTFIKGQLADVVHQAEFDKLEGRVEYLENILKVAVRKK